MYALNAAAVAKTTLSRFTTLIVKGKSIVKIARAFGTTISEPQTRPPSYVFGESTSNKTMVYSTIGEQFDRIAYSHADKEAIVVCHQGIRKTYAEYSKDVEHLAAGLLALGFRTGDRLAIWCPNSYEWTLVQFATAKLGIILTTLNPAYQSAEVEDCLKKVSARGLIMTDKFKTQDFYKLITKVAPELADSRPGNTKAEKLPDLETVIMISEQDFPGTFNFKDVLLKTMAADGSDRDRVQAIQSGVMADDVIMIQFSSGTTGKPKAIALTHHNLYNGCILNASRLQFDFSKEHRLCILAPLFHAMASLITLNAICFGFCTVLPSPSFNPALALKTLMNEKCTWLAATPTMFIDMFHHPDFATTDLSSLRGGVAGGANCPPELIKAVATKFHCPGIVVGYGATETSGGAFIHSHDTPLKEKLASDGRIYDYLEAKVVNDRDQVVPMGTPGEICVRGYKIMLGYWNDDEKNREALKNGWFYTGDIGILKEDKTVKVLDRKKDIIIRGGENISPREIEEYLLEHPKIQEVYVIGVPDERMGEEVCAWIRLKEGESLTEEQIRKRCQGNIAHFKIPRYVRFVKEFPRTPTGKVQKNLMRDTMRKEMSAVNTSQ